MSDHLLPSSCVRIRVLLVDDHPMMRRGLRTVLESYDDLEIVGEAENGMQAVIAVEWLKPSVIVMDVNMPVMNGIEATADIKSRHPSITVIGMSVQGGGAVEVAMKKAGELMLLPKEAAVSELYLAIQNTRLQNTS